MKIPFHLSNIGAVQLDPDKQLLYFILAGILILATIGGIILMSKVPLAKLGNRIGAVSSLLAILVTLWVYNVLSFYDLWIALLIGLLLGIVLAYRVKMIQMPQMVALLNGLGGAASFIAAGLTLWTDYADGSAFLRVTAALAIAVGSITFSGSLVAAGKLHKILPQAPKKYPLHELMSFICLGASAVIIIIISGKLFTGNIVLGVLLTILYISALFFGFLFAMRVGGADMPITISLLNSLSGLSGAIAGLAISDPLLVAIGGIVGVSGLLLTQIMCRAMNRHLTSILLGKTSAHKPDPTNTTVDLKINVEKESILSEPVDPVDETAKWATEANSVIIVPGYGMALAQAQLEVKELMEQFEAAGKTVRFAIHPVAGRMPGHMNVLLAEVDIPYDAMHELQDINDDFESTDLVVIIGANDVVNPAARTAEGTPIYGMPVLDVDKAAHVLIFNYDRQPGYAGVDNPLYSADPGRVKLIEGNAKQTLREFLQSAADAEAEEVQDSSGPVDDTAKWATEANSVIIVPGYGMALAQAQLEVKELMEQFEAAGKTVRFAIHPVAGRMPGHMNVLLAEVDIPYDAMHELQDINDDFESTDLVVIIGANDVVNPAARTAEGTPIYGMPVLDVDKAAHVLIFNYDRKPGYAGVDNPLYSADPGRVKLIEGNAKQTLGEFLKKSI